MVEQLHTAAIMTHAQVSAFWFVGLFLVFAAPLALWYVTRDEDL